MVKSIKEALAAREELEKKKESEKSEKEKERDDSMH